LRPRGEQGSTAFREEAQHANPSRRKTASSFGFFAYALPACRRGIVIVLPLKYLCSKYCFVKYLLGHHAAVYHFHQSLYQGCLNAIFDYSTFTCFIPTIGRYQRAHVAFSGLGRTVDRDRQVQHKRFTVLRLTIPPESK